MDDAKEMLKKYWPYIVGAVIALLILVKMSRGSAAASTGDNGLANYYAAQAQATAQSAAIGLQSQQQQNAFAIAQGTLNSENLQTQIAGQVAWNDSQAKTAEAIGNAAAKTITALQLPIIGAIQSGAEADQAALSAASNTAVASYLGVTSMTNAAAQLPSAVASAVRGGMVAGFQNVNTNNAAQSVQQSSNAQAVSGTASASAAANSSSNKDTLSTVAQLAMLFL